MSGNNIGNHPQKDMGERSVKEMTLRQHFAAMAMQAIVSEHNTARRIGHQEDGIGTMARAAAVMAVECADALLPELEKEQTV